MDESLASLLTFAAVATITPGGATLLVAASGARFGFQRSLPLVMGMAGGVAFLMAASAAGLAALLLAAPALQVLLRAVGSSYLLWLAWQIARSGAPNVDREAGRAPAGFVGGFILLCLNPKVWTIAVAAGGAYAGLTASPLRLALLFGAVFGVAAVVALSLWCGGGLALARLIRTPLQWRAVNMTLGALLAASVVPIWL